MNPMNRAILIGHVTRISSYENGSCKIELTTTNARKVDNDWTETSTTHKVTARGPNAAFLAKYAGLGDLIAVDCKLEPTRTEDGTTVRLIVDRIAALHSRVRRDADQATDQRLALADLTPAPRWGDDSTIPF